MAGAVAGSGLAGAGLAGAAQAASDSSETAEAAAILARYEAFGGKASGGTGELACGAWLESELAALGFATERQVINAPYFEVTRADLVCGATTASVIPQAIVAPTGPGGVTGPLVLAGSGNLKGAIALITLAHARWSTANHAAVRGPLAEAAAAGAKGAVLVTTGPTGLAVALNARIDGLTPIPAAVLAPKDAAPFLAAANRGEAATLTLDGRGGMRPSYNLIVRKGGGGGGRARALIVSTPRSGWFGCVGERGPGLAAWLMLARRFAAMPPPGVPLVFVCTSNHEYENAGSAAFIRGKAPAPENTALWLHLGAGCAARDWHELGPTLQPLPSADPQRFLVATPKALPLARAAFAGQPGLEAAYATGPVGGGEVLEILSAGYGAAGHGEVAAIFGAHRFHHTTGDDARCADPAHTALVASASERLVRDLVR